MFYIRYGQINIYSQTRPPVGDMPILSTEKHDSTILASTSKVSS